MIQFDWDDENKEHIARHGVRIEEAEFVLNGLTSDLGFQDWHDEPRFADAGATRSGRIIVVITTSRGLKTRVVTAFDAPQDVVEEYRSLMVS